MRAIILHWQSMITISMWSFPAGSGVDLPYQIVFTRKPLAGGEWSSAEAVISGNFDAVRPDIFVDPTNGRLHVIASSYDNAPYLYYRSSDTQGTTWNSLRQFNPSNTSDNRTIYAAIYAHGDNLYVVTRTVETFFIFNYLNIFTVHSTDGGLTWIEQTKISAHLALNTGEYGISLAGVGDRLYMGYEVGTSLYFRRNDGAGWSDYLTLETGDTSNIYKWPSITQSAGGQAWMLFELNGQLYKRYYDGNDWQAKEIVGRGTYPNLKLGTGDDRVEWVYTICNGSPFDIAYGSLNVLPNSAPQADDQNVSTNEATPVNITLTASDPEGDPLTYIILSGPSHGTLTGTPPNLTYTPAGGYFGPDSFTFKANDGNLDSNVATVSITVNSVNNPPEAVDDSAQTVEDTPVIISVIANDSDLDGDALTVSEIGIPLHGTAVINGGGTTVTYTPSAGYSGPDRFNYTVSDGNGGTASAMVSITVLSSDLIFTDGFEGGNLSGWSKSVTDGGDLSVSAAAALKGSYGMKVLFDDNVPKYVEDQTPTAEGRYRMRFYFDPNTITMASGDTHYIFTAFRWCWQECIRCDPYASIMAHTRSGHPWWTMDLLYSYTSYYTLTDASHYLEIDWQAASAPEANDGYLSLWIDGVLKQTRSGIDNDTRRVDYVRLGPWIGIDSGTRGAYYIDAFESHRQSPVGMAGVRADFSALPTSGSAPLTVAFTSLSVPGDKITDYLWDFGDGGTSTVSQPGSRTMPTMATTR